MTALLSLTRLLLIPSAFLIAGSLLVVPAAAQNGHDHDHPHEEAHEHDHDHNHDYNHRHDHSDRALRSNTKGLFLQVALNGQSLDYNEDTFSDTDGGGGLGLRAGWGVSRLVTLYIGLAGARIDGESNGVIDDEYDWGSGEIGARFNFRSGRAWVPYVDVALQGVTARNDDLDLEFQGGGIALGGGVSYFLSRSVALDASLRFGGGEFNEVEFGQLGVDIEEDNFNYGEGRFSLGLTFYPLR